MDNKIKFSGYLTFEDSLKVQKALESKKWLSYSAFITITTLVITGFIIYKMQADLLLSGFLLLFMGVFMYGGFRFMKTTAKKTQKNIYEKACTKRNGILTNDKITIRKNKTTTDIPWKYFEQAFETDGIITLIKGKEALSFAKYMFHHKKDWNKAKGIIKNKYPLAFKD